MKKLTLDPAELRVQSFAPIAAQGQGERPVRGAEATVTCIYPRCGTVMREQSCYNGCTDPDVC